LLLLGLFVPMTLGLAILFVVLGVLLIVTGALQYCPLYSVLKLSTKK
jgi:cytochrome bd-type quinol oxidase subunit 1